MIRQALVRGLQGDSVGKAKTPGIACNLAARILLSNVQRTAIHPSTNLHFTALGRAAHSPTSALLASIKMSPPQARASWGLARG